MTTDFDIRYKPSQEMDKEVKPLLENVEGIEVYSTGYEHDNRNVNLVNYVISKLRPGIHIYDEKN